MVLTYAAADESRPNKGDDDDEYYNMSHDLPRRGDYDHHEEASWM